MNKDRIQAIADRKAIKEKGKEFYDLTEAEQDRCKK